MTGLLSKKARWIRAPNPEHPIFFFFFRTPNCKKAIVLNFYNLKITCLWNPWPETHGLRPHEYRWDVIHFYSICSIYTWWLNKHFSFQFKRWYIDFTIRSRVDERLNSPHKIAGPNHFVTTSFISFSHVCTSQAKCAGANLFHKFYKMALPAPSG